MGRPWGGYKFESRIRVCGPLAQLDWVLKNPQRERWPSKPKVPSSSLGWVKIKL